jgi:hypothetical protein
LSDFILGLILLPRGAALACAGALLLIAAAAMVPFPAPWRAERNHMTAEVRAMPRPDPEEEPGEGAPKILRLTTSGKGAARKRVPLFYIDDVEYTTELHPSPARGLKYLHLLRTEGTDVATQYMLETLIGAEGYEALMEYEDLTDEQLEQVVTAASKILLGAVEGPKEPPKKQPRRRRG